ncbi:MAG TPA: phosphoribosyltransferase family protein, partial [Candidatus Angelobacter sp.]|nr:phosphoribosyltransferase family protein [Candidatus Angelobacter sp.]
MNSIQSEYPRILLTADQIKKRVQEMARRISADFQGKTLHVVGVMENGFVFMADLVRELDL